VTVVVLRSGEYYWLLEINDCIHVTGEVRDKELRALLSTPSLSSTSPPPHTFLVTTQKSAKFQVLMAAIMKTIGFLRCRAVQSGRSLQTIQGFLLPLPSRHRPL
jgi:hypothetical protein